MANLLQLQITKFSKILLFVKQFHSFVANTVTSQIKDIIIEINKNCGILRRQLNYIKYILVLPEV